MTDPRIQLKNPFLAGVLGYVVPGAGHLYQGRIFKGCIYLICILGAYLYGLQLSGWNAVYWRWEPRHHHIAFFAQAGVGAFAVPALVQSKRFRRSADGRDVLNEPLTADFVGVMNKAGRREKVSGRVRLKPVEGEFGPEVRGTFKGTVVEEDGAREPIELALIGDTLQMGLEVSAGSRREFGCEILEIRNGREERVGFIAGTIPRSFFNYFAVPLQDQDLQRLNRDLGRQYELAKVFTWIAGLLNILAVWDALEGPAYGYGDEEESAEEKDDKKKPKAADPPAQQTPPEESRDEPKREAKEAVEKPTA